MLYDTNGIPRQMSLRMLITQRNILEGYIKGAQEEQGNIRIKIKPSYGVFRGKSFMHKEAENLLKCFDNVLIYCKDKNITGITSEDIQWRKQCGMTSNMIGCIVVPAGKRGKQERKIVYEYNSKELGAHPEKLIAHNTFLRKIIKYITTRIDAFFSENFAVDQAKAQATTGDIEKNFLRASWKHLIDVSQDAKNAKEYAKNPEHFRYDIRKTASDITIEQYEEFKNNTILDNTAVECQNQRVTRIEEIAVQSA